MQIMVPLLKTGNIDVTFLNLPSRFLWSYCLESKRDSEISFLSLLSMGSWWSAADAGAAAPVHICALRDKMEAGELNPKG